jgi:predicted Fe-Mo cluster-binding NifX family protein
MRVTVTANGTGLDAELDVRFGRAAYFVVVDTETLSYHAVENKQNANLPQGAGIQAAQNVVAQDVQAVITGNCGPKAFRVLQAAGIEVLIGARGSVRDVIAQHQAGELETANQPNVTGHWV